MHKDNDVNKLNNDHRILDRTIFINTLVSSTPNLFIRTLMNIV